MADLNKFSIESWEQWFTLKISEKTDITDKELADVLSEQDISRIQKLKLAKKREQYEKLQPAGFEHAPESAKQKREELKNTDNVEKMKWCQDNISYNADHTINIIAIKKTFCEDISGQNNTFTFAQAQELEKTNVWWYRLMTDYNETDTEQEKKQTDWYKVVNLFGENTWDTTGWMAMFRDMSWCNNRYWTATPYKDEKWKLVSGVVRTRLLNEDYCDRNWDNAYYNNRVCGFKDSM
ncbi:MAG: hypothetical protein ACD_71C00199G0001 [uncultured bacterium (gcode 4)]|uniref:Uncharacterized protein n=1 Tax=uncultured bacterium (gcode 4) TaxID=1234023 RepID=K1YMQ8_9BACT|nr:MAG: hypothetical protein ACD_71C00199G0001 [uncultured bacterium (gcode 4)]